MTNSVKKYINRYFRNFSEDLHCKLQIINKSELLEALKLLFNFFFNMLKKEPILTDQLFLLLDFN